MINELKRLFNDKFIIPIWTLIIISLCVGPIIFMFMTNYNERNTSYLMPYNNEEEIKQIIETYNSEYDRSLTNKDKEKIKKELDLYNYLYENNLKYDDIRMDMENINSNNKISYIKIAVSISLFVVSILIMLVNIKIFNMDVSRKTYKYIYNDYKKAQNVFFKKALTSLLITLMIFIISLLILFIISLNYSLDFKYIIFSSPYVYKMTVNNYIFNSYIFYFLSFLCIEISFIVISGIYLNSFITFIIGLIINILLFVSNKISSFLSYAFADFQALISNGNDLASSYIILFIRLFVVILLFILLIIYLKKIKFVNNIIYENVYHNDTLK